MKRHPFHPLPPLLCVYLIFASQVAQGQVVNSEWNTGNGAWNIASNWAPVDVPDNSGGFTYNVMIGNRPLAANALVSFAPEDGNSDTVSTLTVLGGADFFTNSHQLNVEGKVGIEGTGSGIHVDRNPGTGSPALQVQNLELKNGGVLFMNGGTVTVGELLRNTNSTITGFGTIQAGDGGSPGAAAIVNSGLITVSGTPTAPGVLTLSVSAFDTIDLDGAGDNAVVDVSNAEADPELDTLTLILPGKLSDPFGGAPGSALKIGQRDTITFQGNIAMTTGASVQMDGGTNVATLNGSAITPISGANFAITGAAVIDAILTFSTPDSTISVGANSTLTLKRDVTLPDATALSLAANSAWVIAGRVTIEDPTHDFNWDGTGSATTTLEDFGNLTLDVKRIDTANDVYGGTLNLNDESDVFLTNAADVWTLAGTINKNNAGTSAIQGSDLIVNGQIHGNAGTLRLPKTTLQSSASVTADGVVELTNGSILAGPGTLNGNGTLRLEGSDTVAASTTVAVNTFDWDGTSTAVNLQTIANGVIFTINSPNFDTDGDMDDAISLGGNGAELIVSGPAQWTMNGTLTANAAAAGTATIGGTSRLVLNGITNVDGNTAVTGPVTFGAGAAVSIDTGMRLDAGGTATYAGGAIAGAGTYAPALLNTVTASTSITVVNLDFDGGNWTVQNNALLTVNVTDADAGTTVNAHDGTINLNDADIKVTTGDAKFVMDGVLNFSTTMATNSSYWDGEPLAIGNDAGVLDARVTVAGAQTSIIYPATDFNSDADVNIAAGSTLHIVGTATFNSVNAANNARFTGGGRFMFSGGVNVIEATTFNMPGGTVDLIGLDAAGDFINIDAPFTINAAAMTAFGRSNAVNGPNTIDINNDTGTGILAVNLDSPASEWRLNAPGVLNLTNDNATLTNLLTGSTVNLYGTVNVNGGAGISARARLYGTTNIASGSLTLQGGSLAETNTIEGGTVSGAGQIRCSASHALKGFGTINAAVNFLTGSDLVASGGTLNINGPITGTGSVRVEAAPAVLNLANPLNTSIVTGTLVLQGGTLQGAAVTTTNGVFRPISGRGLVSSQAINSGALIASGGTLTFTNAASDWDGTNGNGILRAESGGVLEIQDTATFGFGGSVVALANSRVFTNFDNGDRFDFSPGSSLQLTAGTYESARETNLAIPVTVGAGAASTIKVQSVFPLRFQPACVTTLNGNLILQTKGGEIAAGATFSGPGALIVSEGSFVQMAPNTNLNVLLINRGNVIVAGQNTAGRLDVRDFQQSATGELSIEFLGTNLNDFDRLVVNGAAQIGGQITLDVDNPFIPTPGQTFDIITATGGITGRFDPVITSGLPAGLSFTITYLPNTVRVTVGNKSPYELWIEARLNEALGQVIPISDADWAKGGDRDADGLTTIGEFALNGHPIIGRIPNKIFPKVASVGGSNVFTLTIPVRNGAVSDGADPAGGELVLKQTADALTYRIQAGDVLTNNWTLDVTEVLGADATAIRAGLPAVDVGWNYRTFRSPGAVAGAVAGDPREYMRVVVTE